MTLHEAIHSKEKIIEYNGSIFFLGGLDVRPKKGEEDYIDRAMRLYAEKEAHQDEKKRV